MDFIYYKNPVLSCMAKLDIRAELPLFLLLLKYFYTLLSAKSLIIAIMAFITALFYLYSI